MKDIKIITGATGEPHITPNQDAMWHRGLLGDENVILSDENSNNLKAEIISNNTIRIMDGTFSLQGFLGCIEIGGHSNITIENGAQGMNRVDIIAISYTKSYDNLESLKFKVIKGNPTSGTPQAKYSDLNTGRIGEDRAVDCPLYLVRLQGLQIKEIQQVMPVLPVLGDSVAALKKAHDTRAKYPKKVYQGRAMMNGDEERTFEGLAKAPTGLCLVFSPYSGDGVVDGNFHVVTIPKLQIQEFSGKGYDIWLDKGDGRCEKYLYIYTDRVKGYKDNNKNGAQKWALRAMYLV